MGGGNEYSDHTYWEDRYKTTVTTLFDWYNNYRGLKPFLSKLTQRRGKQSRILNLGCGNSPLCEHMYDDGFENIDNVDYSESCIEYMRERNSGVRPGLRFWQADARDMDLEEGAYDLILDKGLVDSLVCGGDSFAGVDSMCSLVARALHPEGAYAVMTYGPPEDRVHLLGKEKYGWEVEVLCLRKPDPDAIDQARPDGEEIHEPVPWHGGEGLEKADGGNGVHYIYVMRKRRGGDGEQEKRSLPPMAAAEEAPAGLEEMEEVDGG